MPITVTYSGSINTSLTCNCLLPWPLDESMSENENAAVTTTTAGTTHSDGKTTTSTAEDAQIHSLLCACYALRKGGGDGHTALHAGAMARYALSGTDAPFITHASTQVANLPGIFDVTWVDASFFANARAIAAQTAGRLPQRLLLSACTDGAVRLAHPTTLETVETFPGIHTEMLTSCTPFISLAGTPQLLCTAHTGTVQVYDVTQACVTETLDGHEFDAWCGAVMPTDGGKATRPLLFSGGDDGLLKFYDMRAGNMASCKCRFDAGVVHIAPVVSTTSTTTPTEKGEASHTSTTTDTSATTAMQKARASKATHKRDVVDGATPYLLVGSYDESLSLLDTRFPKRPVAQQTRLGGGVWRCSRCVYPFYAPSSVSGDHNETSTSRTTYASPRTNLELALASMQTSDSGFTSGTATGSATSGGRGGGFCSGSVVNQSNILAVPLMQRGLALIPYDVRASEDAVFGSARYLDAAPSASATSLAGVNENEANGEERGANGMVTTAAASEECLVYDVAVLGVESEDESNDRYVARLASCSFYEKRVGLWTVKGLTRYAS